MLTLYKYGSNHLITFELATYMENGNLYVGMLSNDDGITLPWQNLTVNLSVKCQDNCAFIDTNNNDDIIDWLEENNLGHCTGNIMPSGWCVYPEFEFNMDELMKHTVLDERKV